MALQSASYYAVGGKVTSITILDLGIGILALLFLVRGLLRGFVHELAGFVGIFLGLFLAGRFYPQLMPQFSGVIESARWAAGLSYGAIFVLTLTFVAVCAALIKRFMTMTFTAWLDNLLGALVGCLKGVFVCAILLALMQRFVPDSPFLKNAVLPGYIDVVVAFARSLLPAFLEAASSVPV
jgi:membrane protein required for colicin V production